MEGNLRFKIDWASLIVGSKFNVFAFFYFVFEANFPSTSPRGLIFEGTLTNRSDGTAECFCWFEVFGTPNETRRRVFDMASESIFCCIVVIYYCIVYKNLYVNYSKLAWS